METRRFEIASLGTGIADAPFAPQNLLAPGMSLEEIASKRNMNFNIGESQAYMLDTTGAPVAVPGRKILFRDDTNQPLSVVGERYKPVSPLQILDFFQEIYSTAGFEMVAAGCLKGGARFWSIAQTGKGAELAGGDKLGQYVFMGTAVDASLATTAFTFTQAFKCWNMAPMMIKNAKQDKQFIKVPHSREFNRQEIGVELGAVAPSFDAFIEEAKHMGSTRISYKNALRYFAGVFAEDDLPETTNWQTADGAELEEAANKKVVQLAMNLFAGAGMGMDCKARKGTVWGAYNCVTELLDHHTGAKNEENAFNNNTFGNGFKTKATAWKNAEILL
jgi:phage/plasmid-like protein (TIGR03299 family)